MKRLRPLFFGVAVVAVLLLVAVALAFSSGVQTWAARRAIASRPDLAGTAIGRLDAGLNRVRVEQLQFTQPGMKVTVPSLDAQLSLIDAARENVQVKKLVAKGWTIDLTVPGSRKVATTDRGQSAPLRTREFSLLPSAYVQAAPPPPSSAVAAFEGVLAQLQLPVDLSLDSAELEGEIIFPGSSGQPPGRAKVTLVGGQLSVGREGAFNFTATVALAPDAPVSSLDARGVLTATMATPRTFSKLAAKIDADARGTQLPQGAKLTTAVSAEQAGSGENYLVSVENAARKLLVVQADYPVGAASLTGTWNVDASDADVRPFALSLALPTFAAKGAGKFETNTAFTTFVASGRLDSNLDQLDTLQPELVALGAVVFGAEFDLAQAGDLVRVNSLTVNLAGARPVLAVRSLQAFEFNFKTRELKTANGNRDLVNVDLQGLPLAWAQAFVKDIEVSGDDLRGAFVVGARNGGFGVRATSPLAVSNLAISQAGQALVRDVSLSAKVTADYTPQGWQAEIAELMATNGQDALLNLDARAGQLAGAGEPLKMTGRFSANLAAVLAQPVAAEYAVLMRGRAAGDFTASLGETQQLQAKLALTELAADPKVTSETLPAVFVEVRADVERGGKVAINAPVVLEREGRKSDLTLSGTAIPVKDGVTVDATLTSESLVVEDAQLLASPLGASPGSTEPSGPVIGGPAERDAKPFWTGVNGRVTLVLKRVIYQEKFEVTNASGTLHLDAGALRIENLKAGLGQESDLKLDGLVSFDGKAAEPYVLKADFALNNFDSVPLFEAIAPGKPATVEGKFNVTSRLNGNGVNAAQLLERTRGEFQFGSKSGVFRALRADVAEAIKAAPSTLSGIVTGIGSLLGKDEKAEKLAQDISKNGKIVTQIADALAEIQFDQLSFAMIRDDALNIRLHDFTLIAPEVRLTGTAEVRHAVATPVLAQPLDLRLQLGARGQLAEWMNSVGMLDGRQDTLGYASFAIPIRVGGTLENPDTNELKAALAKFATSSMLNRFLGR